MADDEPLFEWQNLKEACLATLVAMNEWLASQYPNMALQLDMVDATLAKKLGKVFMAEDLERWVDWDWSTLFHKRVKREKSAWMFAIRVADTPGAVCYGTISLEDSCVSIEYLERRLDAVALKGLAAPIAVQYAEALARYLEFDEVRVCDPDPALVEFYEQNFGLTRHLRGEEVAFLSKKAQP